MKLKKTARGTRGIIQSFSYLARTSLMGIWRIKRGTAVARWLIFRLFNIKLAMGKNWRTESGLNHKSFNRIENNIIIGHNTDRTVFKVIYM